MRRLTTYALALGLLFSAVQAQADPASDDALSGFLTQRGFIERLDSVREKASQLVVHAMGFLGVPYKRGGDSVETGFDCSGFVRAIYEQSAGLLLPRRAAEQAQATQKISKDELRPGDLVFFNTMRQAFSHVGIYIGDGKFIHSPRSGAEVRVEDMSKSYWVQRFNGARRVEGAPANVVTGY